MTDYNWYSAESVATAVEGMRDAADDWHDLAGEMEQVATIAAAQELDEGAFIVIDPLATGVITAVDLKNAYDVMYTLLVGLFKQAVTEFHQFGDALHKCAEWYDDADVNSAHDFDQIAGEADTTQRTLSGRDE